MAKGRQGFLLEGWKFGIYLLVPIGASVYYSDPNRQRAAADYWQYVRYPPNPNIGLKQQIEDMAKQQKQREAYNEQLKLLSEQAGKAEAGTHETDLQKSSGRGWPQWFGFGK